MHIVLYSSALSVQVSKLQINLFKTDLYETKFRINVQEKMSICKMKCTYNNGNVVEFVCYAYYMRAN